MNFTVLITDKCNLNCKYCYENKKKITANRYTLDMIVTFISEEVRERNSSTSINIQGGEVFLTFDKLKYFIGKLNESGIDNLISYISITSNGTIYSKEISDFIIDNNIRLSISIDGNKEQHDYYRVFKNGNGSYDVVMNNLKKYIDDGIEIRCRMTFNSNTILGISDSINNLYGFGLKTFALSYNPFDKNCKSFSSMHLEKEIYKFICLKHKYSDLNISLYDNIKNFFLEKGDCFSGVNSFAIDTKGNIYNCIYTIGSNEHLIGNIREDKYDLKKRAIDKHRDYFDEEYKSECNECSLGKYCDGRRCKFINSKATGKSYLPSYVTCEVSKVLYKVFKENFYGQL